ncbi:MAG: endonuclease III, partial [Selenomonas sp.]|nr:endonuclease III [Selenomonas sp.]
DERVNKTTPALFEKYKSPEDYLKASQEEIEEIIKPCGFYKNKAKNLLGYAKMVVEKYHGELPENMEELVKLPGIGRKSANVIMLEAFNNPQGIAVDTHAKRISNRIGLSNESEPEIHHILPLPTADYFPH